MGGIIDTWVTLFTSDTSSVEDGNNKAGQSADDLIKKLKNTDDVAAQTGDSFKNMITTAAGALAGFFAAKATIGGVFEAATTINELSRTADALGENIEQVDAFGKAAVALGGDAQGARDSLTDMAEKMGEALSDTESGAAKAFAALKIGLKDSKGEAKGAIDGILDLAGAVEGLGRNEAVFKIKELGITDNRTVEMVLKGRKELERLLAKQKEQGVVTKENAIGAEKFATAWGGLTAGFERGGMALSTTLMPIFTKVIEWLTKVVDWCNEHQHVIVGFFGAIATVVAAIYLPAMLAAAAATLAATWPFIAIGAAIALAAAAFALIYDDIMNFIDGNDSFIGQMVEKYPLVKAMVEAVAAAFKFMGDLVMAVWHNITVGFKQMLDFVLAGIKQIASGVSTVAKFFGIGADVEDEKTQGAAEPEKPKAPGREFDTGRSEDVPFVDTSRQESTQQPIVPGRSPDVPMMPEQEREVRQPIPIQRGAFPAQSMNAAQSQLKAAAASPLNSTTSNAISNNANNTTNETKVTIGEVKIETKATDAQGMAAGAADGLKTQLASLQRNSANGRER